MRGKGELRLVEIVFSWVLLQGILKAKVLFFCWGGQKNQKSLVGVDQIKPLLPGFIREYT